MSDAEEDNGKKKVFKQTSMLSFVNKRPKRGRKKKKGRSGVGGRPSLSEQRARDKLIAEAEAEKIIVFNKRVKQKRTVFTGENDGKEEIREAVSAWFGYEGVEGKNKTVSMSSFMKPYIDYGRSDMLILYSINT